MIERNFNSNSDPAFIGNSVSLFSSKKGKWQQTWVDNRGSHMDFAGRFVDEKMILSRTTEREGKIIPQRMVFYNIAEDSLVWN